MLALASFRDLELRVLHWVTCDLGTPFGEDFVFWTHHPAFWLFLVPLLFLLVAVTKRGRGRLPGVLVTLVLTLGVVHGVREVVWRVAPRTRPGASFAETEILRGRVAIGTCEHHPTMWVERAYPPRSSSMPSSHAVSVGALAIAITLGAPWAGVLAWAFAASIGFGRLFLGKHWPSDVVAGFALAILAGVLVHRCVTPRVLELLGRFRRGPLAGAGLRHPPDEPPDAGGLPR